ncbi:hypothetical protein F511_40474 [Dorcoceras hygrometricum]|uniref:Uncharacterized protein n=1 Tax=Dorcoceras hygrometricum TaxID=472368 RepID=A0A2Z7C1I5_9LAMI|nr:hypothetical protein F511_40474 [Dorcoceras hygrometricum]
MARECRAVLRRWLRGDARGRAPACGLASDVIFVVAPPPAGLRSGEAPAMS